MLQIRGIQVDPSWILAANGVSYLKPLSICSLPVLLAAQVWQEILAFFKPFVDSISSLSELLTSNTKMINLPPTGLATTPLYPRLYWHLSKNINMLIFEDKAWMAPEVARKVLLDAHAWEEATRSHRSQGTQQISPSLTSHSTPRSITGFCCYTDGAWDPVSRISGQGWVVYDPLGVSVRHCSSNRSIVLSPLVAEALEVQADLLDAVDNDFSQMNVFSDSNLSLIFSTLRRQLLSSRVSCLTLEFCVVVLSPSRFILSPVREMFSLIPWLN